MLLVTHGESFTKISVDAQGSISSSVVLELWSNQEEADTQMFLHALHASDGARQQILIKSSDIDEEILAFYFWEHISADIFLLSGTRRRACVSSLSGVSGITRLYTLTRCDTVSSFSGKWEKAAFYIMKADKDSRASIHRIGKHVPPMRSYKNGEVHLFTLQWH